MTCRQHQPVLTLGYTLFPTSFALLQIFQAIDCCQNLNSTDSVQHVRIMTGGCTEATVVVLACEDELHCFVTGQGIWMAQKMKRGQSPIDSIQSQVFGQPVIELVFPLKMNQYQASESYSHERTLSRVWMYLTCFSTTKVRSSGTVLDEESDPPTPGPTTRDICTSESCELLQVMKLKSGL